MLVGQEKIRILIDQRTLHAMALLSVQLPRWSNEGIIIRPNLMPSLLKRSRIPTPLTCKKSSEGDLSPKMAATKSEVDSTVVLGRKAFPSDFIFGAASSAYQIEGGADQGGKGPSIFDTFSHNFPEKINGRSNGDIACDSYNRYKDDVKLIKDAGMDTYRFSFSWPRILPTGSLKGCINLDGIQYYDNLIDELIANGIKPFVTLFHWDAPQALEDEYGGFLDRKIVDDFKDFCEICFNEFGDRVKHWITFNEPYTFTSFGYDTGALAPGRCSKGCPVGDSAREPYIASHNIILAHAVVVQLYREKYQATQKGEIGITLNTHWMIPFSSSREDVQAAERQLDFDYGWYLDPIVYGDYPFIMKALVQERLPRFTKEESDMIKGSYDFIGINYYTSRYAVGLPISSNDVPSSYGLDSYVDLKVEKDGKFIGKKMGPWVYVYPKGIRDLLVYTQQKYNNPPIYITENGTCEFNNDKLKLKEVLDDHDRIRYYSSHLANVREAIKLGVNVKGYIAWSLMDSFEWNSGYSIRFGLAYVDFKDGLKRYPKASLKWFAHFLKK